MTRTAVRYFLSITATVATAACGDNLAAPPDAAIVIAPDAPAAFAEAPHPDVPVVMNAGGNVMAAPMVVPIFFTGDSVVQGQLEQFLGLLPTSPYWHTTTSEYGVGDITIGASIVTSDTPPISDADLQTWLAGYLDGTHADWPAPTPNTIYTVFLPAGAVLSLDGSKSCETFGGYHAEAATAAQQSFSYALLPRCGVGQEGLDETTLATSHELIEASTDPLPYSNPAFLTLDDEHFVWGRTPGGELGDMCEYLGSAKQKLVGDFYVQRTWSNASAAAGHDPCVPVLATPYVAAAPVFDDMTIMSHNGTLMTKGLSLPMGMSKTIELDLFSDAPAPNFIVEVADATSVTGGTSTLSFQLDQGVGGNGDKLMLTITRTGAVTHRGSEILITALLGNTEPVSLWWGYVGP